MFDVTPPRVDLIPMTDEQLAERIPRLKADWTDGVIRASGLPRADATAKFAGDLAKHLPGGRPRLGERWLTVLVDGSPGGMIWIGPREELGPGAWWVWHIEVDEGLRGRGIGRAVMQRAEQHAREAGAHSLGLMVSGDNGTARHLYHSLGFQTMTLQMHLAL